MNWLGNKDEPEADAPVEGEAVDAAAEVEPQDDTAAYIAELKAKVNEYSGKADHFQRELGAALKENESLVAVQAENTELQDKVGSLLAQIDHLEEALRVAQTKLDRADAIVAAGKAIKQGLADLG